MASDNYVDRIRQYLGQLDFVEMDRASILLSGSTGWGIAEGLDRYADWDLHVILSHADYKNLVQKLQGKSVVSDNSHCPPVFIQLRTIDWLRSRLVAREKRPLYLWIYTHGMWVSDSQNIQSLIESETEQFFLEYDQVCQEAYVEFSVRRFDATSSSKRELLCSSLLYQSAMVRSALRAYCLFNRVFYPYDKWLLKQVELIEGESQELTQLCQNCLKAQTYKERIHTAKMLQRYMEHQAISIFGPQRWITHWWEYNEN